MRILKVITLAMLVMALNVQANVHEVTKESDIKPTGYAVVKFYAVWCGPCKMFKPEFEKLAAKYSNKGSFYAVNADEQSAILSKHGVRSLPTIAIFKDGKLVEKFGASETESKLEALPGKEMPAATRKEPSTIKRSKTPKPAKKQKKSCSDCGCK